MTLVLWDINVSKRNKNSYLQHSHKEEWSLEDYYSMAERCIGKFSDPYVAKTMLRNEDAVSFIAEHLMYGAYRWKSDGGRTLRSYLNQCAIWAIHRWLLRQKQSAKHNMLSLNYNTSDCDSSASTLHEYVEDNNASQPDSDMLNREHANYISKILHTSGLTDKQRSCVELVYIQEQKPAEVARNLGVSRQAVDQCLSKAISKLRSALHGQEETLICS